MYTTTTSFNQKNQKKVTLKVLWAMIKNWMSNSDQITYFTWQLKLYNEVQ